MGWLGYSNGRRCRMPLLLSPRLGGKGGFVQLQRGGKALIVGLTVSLARANHIMDLMYEHFEHTADLGLRIRAPDLESLFAEAAQSLFAAIVEDLATIQPICRVDIQLSGDDREYLLFDWLKELLYHFDTEHLLFARFEVRLQNDMLTGSAWGEPVDRQRHALEHEVKAITYHGLKVEKTLDGWLAEVIVDI